MTRPPKAEKESSPAKESVVRSLWSATPDSGTQDFGLWTLAFGLLCREASNPAATARMEASRASACSSDPARTGRGLEGRRAWSVEREEWGVSVRIGCKPKSSAKRKTCSAHPFAPQSRRQIRHARDVGRTERRQTRSARWPQSFAREEATATAYWRGGNPH